MKALAVCCINNQHLFFNVYSYGPILHYWTWSLFMRFSGAQYKMGLFGPNPPPQNYYFYFFFFLKKKEKIKGVGPGGYNYI